MNAKNVLYILLLITNIQFVFSQQKIKKNCESRIEKINSPTLSSFYETNDSCIYIFSSLSNKLKKKPEYTVYWHEQAFFNKLAKKESNSEFKKILSDKGVKKKWVTASINYNSKKLSGIKIAIDPGHTASDLATAKLEKRFLELKANLSVGLFQDVTLMEGELTLATALILKKQLEGEGAEVMLTREKGNTSSLGISFEEWLKASNLVATKDNKRKLADQYFNKDLIARANKINEYNPDVAIIIHYNVDEKNVGWKKPSPKNFCMAFVGYDSSWGNTNLENENNRLEFLKYILDSDYENSVSLSSEVVKKFNEILQVSIAETKDADYLIKKSSATKAKGVYSRNLALTRMVKCPLVYGECVYQDNIQECVKLNNRDIQINDSLKTSSRVKDVANAYFEGVLKFFEEK